MPNPNWENGLYLTQVFRVSAMSDSAREPYRSFEGSCIDLKPVAFVLLTTCDEVRAFILKFYATFQDGATTVALRKAAQCSISDVQTIIISTQQGGEYETLSKTHKF